MVGLSLRRACDLFGPGLFAGLDALAGGVGAAQEAMRLIAGLHDVAVVREQPRGTSDEESGTWSFDCGRLTGTAHLFLQLRTPAEPTHSNHECQDATEEQPQHEGAVVETMGLEVEGS